MSCTVRRAHPGDADVLFGLAERFATSFRPAREAFEASFRHLLADDAAWLAVAETDGAVVGYCLGFDHFTFYGTGGPRGSRRSWSMPSGVGRASARCS